MNQIPPCDCLPEQTRWSDNTAWNNISAKFKQLHESFLLQNIFCDSKKIFCDFPVGMELENEKTAGKCQQEWKQDVDEFQECILLQKLANTKVKTKSDRWWHGVS